MDRQLMITADEITAMQEVLEDTMPDTAVIYRLTRTEDSSMGYTEAWTPADPVPVRLAPLAGGVGGAMAEALIQGRIGTAEAWIASFPVDTDVLGVDRVVVGDVGFEVALVLDPRTWLLNRRAVLVRLA